MDFDVDANVCLTCRRHNGRLFFILPVREVNLKMTSLNVNAFSPITLFESTITNATMLTETMSQGELLTAHHISTRLQSCIVGALHKLSENLAREVECQRAAAETAQVRLADAQAQVHSAEARLASTPSSTSVSRLYQSSAPSSGLTSFGVKLDNSVLRRYSSEPSSNNTSDLKVKTEVDTGEDCILLDDLAPVDTSLSVDGPPLCKRRTMNFHGNTSKINSSQSVACFEPKVSMMCYINYWFSASLDDFYI